MCGALAQAARTALLNYREDTAVTQAALALLCYIVGGGVQSAAAARASRVVRTGAHLAALTALCGSITAANAASIESRIRHSGSGGSASCRTGDNELQPQDQQQQNVGNYQSCMVSKLRTADQQQQNAEDTETQMQTVMNIWTLVGWGAAMFNSLLSAIPAQPNRAEASSWVERLVNQTQRLLPPPLPTAACLLHTRYYR